MRRTVILLALVAAALATAVYAQQPVDQKKIGGQDVTVLSVTPSLVPALSTSVTTIRSSAGGFESYECYNPNSSVAYVQVFDISGTVTLGSSTPKQSIGIPATNRAGLSDLAMPYSNAIKVAATTTATGSTAPTTALVCNFGYW
jgi:hypothetical protein